MNFKKIKRIGASTLALVSLGLITQTTHAETQSSNPSIIEVTSNTLLSQSQMWQDISAAKVATTLNDRAQDIAKTAKKKIEDEREEKRKAEEKERESEKQKEAERQEAERKPEQAKSGKPYFGSDGLLVMSGTGNAQTVVNQLLAIPGHSNGQAQHATIDPLIDTLSVEEATWVIHRIEGAGFGQTGAGWAGVDSPASHQAFVNQQVNGRFGGSVHALLKAWGTFSYGGY